MKNNSLAAHAWRRMQEKRHCLPLSVLKEGGERVEKHLKTCAFCNEAVAMADAIFDAAKNLMLSADPTSPIPGDVRRLSLPMKPSDMVNAQGLQINPPLVLILKPADTNGFFRVAQIFDEEDLCGPADISLGNGFFAEGWNIYGVHISGFDSAAVFHVGVNILNAVQDTASVNCTSIEPANPLYHFRRDELDTGGFCSMVINGQAILEIEKELSKLNDFVSKKNVLPFSIAGVPTATDKASSHAVTRGLRLLQEWNIGEIAYAAASFLDFPEDAPDLRLQLRALVGSSDQLKTLPAEGRVYYTEDGYCLCVYIRLPEREYEGFMSVNGQNCGKVIISRKNGYIRLVGDFTGEFLPEDIRVVIVESEAD